MNLPAFDYHAPRKLEELFALLAAHRGKSRVLAGGTDLLVAMKLRQLRPEVLIDLREIKNLRGIAWDEAKGLSIGAATRLEEIERSSIVREKYFALHQAVAAIGSPQVRAMATLGGNSCNASPAADSPPALIAHGARVRLAGPSGRRELSLQEFITGNRQTLLAPDEILESFLLPLPRPHSASRFLALGLREAMECDMLNVAVNLALDRQDRSAGRIQEATIVMGAVGPTPLRALRAEAILRGASPTDSVLDQAAREAAAQTEPISDFRASAVYRREVVRVLAGRCLREALAAVPGARG